MLTCQLCAVCLDASVDPQSQLTNINGLVEAVVLESVPGTIRGLHFFALIQREFGDPEHQNVTFLGKFGEKAVTAHVWKMDFENMPGIRLHFVMADFEVSGYGPLLFEIRDSNDLVIGRYTIEVEPE